MLGVFAKAEIYSWIFPSLFLEPLNRDKIEMSFHFWKGALLAELIIVTPSEEIQCYFIFETPAWQFHFISGQITQKGCYFRA